MGIYIHVNYTDYEEDESNKHKRGINGRGLVQESVQVNDIRRWDGRCVAAIRLYDFDMR